MNGSSVDGLFSKRLFCLLSLNSSSLDTEGLLVTYRENFSVFVFSAVERDPLRSGSPLADFKRHRDMPFTPSRSHLHVSVLYSKKFSLL